MLRGEHDAALELLHAAAELRPGGAIVNEAIAKARRAEELAASMAEHQQQASVDLVRRDAEEDRRREEADAKTLRNADVIEMVREGVPTSVILTMLAGSKHDFDTSPAAIIALVNAGVDEQIVNAMVSTGSAEPQADAGRDGHADEGGHP